MGLDEKVNRCVIRPKRIQVEQYIDGLICDFIYYVASVESLGKIRSAIRTAEFMGYPVHDYYSIWDELSGHIEGYSTLQSEVLKNGKS